MISNRTISSTQGWMLDLPLTDKQEKLYALIYSKTDSGGRWAMTAGDVARWCRCSERHAQRLIRELEDLGLIAHEVVVWKNGRKGGRKTEFWALEPEEQTPAPDGSKTKISWKENGGSNEGGITTRMSLPHHDTDVVTHHDTDVVTPIIDSNNNKHTTTNTLHEEEGASACFVAPTVAEVTEYAKAQGFADPEGFADYYVRYQTEAGWMTGKGSKRHQITNWKLNVIQWSQFRKNQVFSQPQQTNQRPAPQPRPAKRVVEISDEEFASLFR